MLPRAGVRVLEVPVEQDHRAEAVPEELGDDVFDLAISVRALSERVPGKPSPPPDRGLDR